MEARGFFFPDVIRYFSWKEITMVTVEPLRSVFRHKYAENLLHCFTNMYKSIKEGALALDDEGYSALVNIFDDIRVGGGEMLDLLRETVRLRGDAFDPSCECAAFVLAAENLGYLAGINVDEALGGSDDEA